MDEIDLSEWDIVDELLLIADEERRKNGKNKAPTIRNPIPGHIYVLKSWATGLYKVGCTRDLKRRLAEFETGSPEKLTLEISFHVSDMYAAEKNLHEMYSKWRSKGEWFELDNQVIAELRASINYPIAYAKFIEYLERGRDESGHLSREWLDTDIECKAHMIALGIIESDDFDLVESCRSITGWDDLEIDKWIGFDFNSVD